MAWFRIVLAGAVLSLIALASTMPAAANPQDTNAITRYMRVFGAAAPPYGFVQFCRSFHGECKTKDRQLERLQATPERLVELDRINRAVNAMITPATDREIFGMTEYWTLPEPGARGDCEDYAIKKRRLLMDAGWPGSALLLTVVRDEAGDGHAVLTARMAQGDFILDNRVDDVRPWHETSYQYLMRQSYLNARVWMALDPSLRDTAQMLGGVASQ